MAYNEQLADRVRELLVESGKVEEKKMFGGLCFMLNGKMCLGIVKDELMARIDPEFYEEALTRKGCREMDFNGKPMKGYVFVGREGLRSPKELSSWIGLALDFNSKAKAAPKKKKAKGKVR